MAKGVIWKSEGIGREIWQSKFGGVNCAHPEATSIIIIMRHLGVTVVNMPFKLVMDARADGD